jgi:hypothetical protein
MYRKSPYSFRVDGPCLDDDRLYGVWAMDRPQLGTRFAWRLRLRRFVWCSRMGCKAMSPQADTDHVLDAQQTWLLKWALDT